MLKFLRVGGSRGRAIVGINKKLTIISLCLVFVSYNYIFAQDYSSDGNTTNLQQDIQPDLLEDGLDDNPNDSPAEVDTYGVSQYLSGNFTDGLYYVEGFVVNLYKCKQCLEGEDCEPCKPANIIISDDNKRINSYKEMGGSDLMVYVSNQNLFKVGNKYKFLLKVLQTQSTPQNIFDVQVVNYEAIF